MANVNLVNDLVMTDAVRVFRNNTVLTNAIGPQYDSTYETFGAKSGQAINIQVPQEFTTRNTFAASVQDVEQKQVTLTRSVVRGIDIRYSSAEMTQDNVDGFVKNKVAPAMSTLAASVDSYIYETVSDGIANSVALPTTALDRQDILNAGVKLDNGLAPRDGTRRLILNPQGMADVVNDSSGLFNAASNISQQYKDGIVDVNTTLGFGVGMSQNVSTHTTGGYDANYDVATVPTSGDATLDVDTGTGTITKGDVFTIDSVFEVNALTKVSTGKLKQFVVTADSAGGTVTLSIDPPMISTGQYQNISELPALNDDLVFTGTASTAYPQALAFHPSFAALGFMDLNIPRSAVYGARKQEDGISIRCIEWYDGINDQEYLRFDVLFGVSLVIPRFAARIYSF